MNKKLVTACSRLLWDMDLLSSRFILGASELMWALLLGWPGDSFSRPMYAEMAWLGPENAWATVFFISGAVQLGICFKSNVHTTFARGFAVWNWAFRSLVAFCLLNVMYPPAAAAGGEVTLSLVAGWIVLRPRVLTTIYRKASHDKGTGEAQGLVHG